MKVMPLVCWRYFVVNGAKLIPYETTLCLTLTHIQYAKFRPLVNEFVCLKRLTYFDRLSTHPSKYYDYKRKHYSTPHEIKRLNLDVKHLDFLYAELIKQPHEIKSLRLRVGEEMSHTTASLHRNQTLYYPAFCKNFFEDTYDHVGLVFPTDHFSSTALLYDLSFLTRFFFCASVANLIHWLNQTYFLFLQPGQYTVTHRRLLQRSY